jgi:hypothetical protein
MLDNNAESPLLTADGTENGSNALSQLPRARKAVESAIELVHDKMAAVIMLFIVRKRLPANASAADGISSRN